MKTVTDNDKAIITAKNLFFSHFLSYFNVITYDPTNFIKVLAEKNNIKYDYYYFKRAKSLSGMLIIDELEYTITINKNQSPRRQLFTFAHELGHFFLHRDSQLNFHDYINDISGKNTSLIERQANAFASELLMPEAVIEEFLTSFFSFGKIIRRLGVSASALKWRLVRYLKDNYALSNSYSQKVVEEYMKHSSKKRIDEPSIFKHIYKSNHLPFLDPYRYPLDSLGNIDKEDENEEELESEDKEVITFQEEMEMAQFSFPEVDENMRFIVCPICRNDNFSSYAKHCKRCGQLLYNNCKNDNENDPDSCGKKNVGDAIHCEYCGKQTVIGELYQNWEGDKFEVAATNEETPALLDEGPIDINDDDLPF